MQVGHVVQFAPCLLRKSENVIEYASVAPYDLSFGPVAQLGEHHNGIVGVKGSSPFRSTKDTAIKQSGPAESPFVSERMGFFVLSRRRSASRNKLNVYSG